jgi:hypothetical protein
VSGVTPDTTKKDLRDITGVLIFGAGIRQKRIDLNLHRKENRFTEFHREVRRNADFFTECHREKRRGLLLTSGVATLQCCHI